MLLEKGRTYFDRHSKTLHALDAAGFKVNQSHKLAHDIDEAWAFIREWAERRGSVPYELDGIGIKVDPPALQGERGVTGRAPRWATADQYTARAASSEMDDIRT